MKKTQTRKYAVIGLAVLLALSLIRDWGAETVTWANYYISLALIFAYIDYKIDKLKLYMRGRQDD